MKALVVVLLALIINVYGQGGNQKCAQNGEYCLTHNDCCSRSCLSFSYKCVPVPPSASFGSTVIPVSNTFENRFGASGGDGGASLTQKTCALEGEYCLTHGECCSGNCLFFSYKCVKLNNPNLSDVSSTREPSTSVTPIDLSNRVGEDALVVTSTTVKSSNSSMGIKKCSEIGEYCLTPNDCCSGSCLSFSYKCVTNNVLKGSSNQQQSHQGSSAINSRFGDSTLPNTTTCAAIGEYCLTSSECCSRSCLSFAYKCVNTYDLITPQAQNKKTTAVTTANRFGGSLTSVNATSPAKRCISNGFYCLNNSECCSNACFKSVCSTEIRLGVPETVLTQPSVANGPYVPVRDLDDLITKFGGQTTQESHQQHRACIAVGDRCNDHGDCCSKNCHSYRRKCVN
uniref:Putative phenoloxidase inhibitor-like protein n=2 Tax=Anopheles triannulatus TaxID=58253 RepID=A0A2M4AHZ5_9DIPT